MAVVTKWFGRGLRHVALGDVLWVPDTIYGLLTTSAYVPDQDLHEFRSDVTNEITGTGYTAGGVSITTKSLSYDATSNELRFLGDDAVWGPGATITARILVLYKHRGGASNADELLGWVDFGADDSVNVGTFTVDSDNTSGWLRVTAS